VSLLVGVTLTVLATACASAPESDPVAAETAADDLTTNDVNACRVGPSVEILRRDGSAQSAATGTYDSEAGTEVVVDPNFNGFESGFAVIIGDYAAEVVDSSIESCSGRLRLLPHARIRFGQMPEGACKPDGITAVTCELADGTAFRAITYLAAQNRGFMVTTEDLNLRMGPTTSSAILETMPKGTIVRLTGEWTPAWRSVSRGDRTGWVNSTWLSGFRGTAVTRESLRIRQYASLNAPVLKLIPRGETVTVPGWAIGQFHLAEHGGVRGFVSGEWLENPTASQ
jgi:uncharacterized protein YgiM (DUF1202 family)